MVKNCVMNVDGTMNVVDNCKLRAKCSERSEISRDALDRDEKLRDRIFLPFFDYTSTSETKRLRSWIIGQVSPKEIKTILNSTG